ncbi:MAG: glycosyl transferase family 1 [Cenarchaeum symbiont of Oopsacas minuta]|nr:glycosyl transferase family 1 [Cenarchaeum symbiont of Oopsacas minuta]
MRLLIAGDKLKLFHLKEFGETLKKQGHDYRLVYDADVYSGFPTKKISSWFTTKHKFKKLVKEFKPDAVFADRFMHFSMATIEEKIPLFAHLRGDYWTELMWYKKTIYKTPHTRFALWYLDRMVNKCLKDATRIYPICSYLKDIVDTRYPNKSTVLYQGINSSRWYKTDGMDLKHPCVGLVQSANVWVKTKELLLLPRILEKFPNVMFYWVGGGTYQDRILSKLTKYDNFKWLGVLEYYDKIRDFLSEIDIYCLMSGLDMSPLTLQEAQLMEKPVIATKVAGIPEIMSDNNTGYLVGKDNAQEWIQSLSILLNDTKKSNMMGKMGKKFVEKEFNWEKITRDFVSSITNTIM